MEKLLISKEWDRGYAYYAFKPKGYVDNFFERTSGMMGIGYDKTKKRWTAPAREESIVFLKKAFGEDCLVWRGKASGLQRPIQQATKQTVNPKQRPFSGGNARTVKAKRTATLRCPPNFWKSFVFITGSINPNTGSSKGRPVDSIAADPFRRYYARPLIKVASILCVPSIPFVTVTRLICWKPGLPCAIFRNYSATLTAPRPRFILTYRPPKSNG